MIILYIFGGFWVGCGIISFIIGFFCHYKGNWSYQSWKKALPLLLFILIVLIIIGPLGLVATIKSVNISERH